VIVVEGSKSAEYFGYVHGTEEEEEDTGIHQEDGVGGDDDDAKHRKLVKELWAFENCKGNSPHSLFSFILYPGYAPCSFGCASDCLSSTSP